MIKKIIQIVMLLVLANFSLANAYNHHKKHSHVRHSNKKSSAKLSHSKVTTHKATTIKSAASDKVNTSPIDAANANNQVNIDAIANQPRLYSYSAIALNAKSGDILVSKNPTAQLPIASISKLMTAMVLLDSGVNLDEYVTIDTSDIDNLKNTFSRLKVGMQLRRRDLLLLALMSSENRAAHALARTAYPDGINTFISKMNKKARDLGMTNTQFYDPTGLTNKNRSTAEDLTKMVQDAFEYEEIRKDTTTKSADVLLGPGYVHRYINSDALVRSSKFPISISKTGFINEAGHCLVLYTVVDRKPIVMVFLNSSGKSGRLVDAITVRNYIQKIS